MMGTRVGNARLRRGVRGVCRIGNQLWLTWWSGPRWPLPLATWLTVYALWGLAQTAFALLQAVFLAAPERGRRPRAGRGWGRTTTPSSR